MPAAPAPAGRKGGGWGQQRLHCRRSVATACTGYLLPCSAQHLPEACRHEPSSTAPQPRLPPHAPVRRHHGQVHQARRLEARVAAVGVPARRQEADHRQVAPPAAVGRATSRLLGRRSMAGGRMVAGGHPPGGRKARGFAARRQRLRQPFPHGFPPAAKLAARPHTPAGGRPPLARGLAVPGLAAEGSPVRGGGTAARDVRRYAGQGGGQE